MIGECGRYRVLRNGLIESTLATGDASGWMRKSTQRRWRGFSTCWSAGDCLRDCGDRGITRNLVVGIFKYRKKLLLISCINFHCIDQTWQR